MVNAAVAGCMALGACLLPNEIQFRVFSDNSTQMAVALFTEHKGQPDQAWLPLHRDLAKGIWSATVTREQLENLHIPWPTASRPLYYGYRASGPNFEHSDAWRPGTLIGFHADADAAGNRFNRNKLLLDPYATMVSHGFELIDDMDVFRTGPEFRALDSALVAPKGVIAPVTYDPFLHPKPTRPFSDDVIYEVHVKGFTMNNPLVPARLRGTFAGLAHMAPYLRELGVTAIELLPIHKKVSTKGKTNYWGYMTESFFAIESSYAYDHSLGGPMREFRNAVDKLHAFGIKVILDVVYNHTGEEEEGVFRNRPVEDALVWSWRGLDNATYYDLAPDRRLYKDNTGCGHNFATYRRAVADLVMASLHYWTEVGNVDGFRFDVGPVLANNPRDGGPFYFDPDNPDGIYERAKRELPVRPATGGAGVDLSVESWGSGVSGIGQFPRRVHEWNPRGRDIMRRAINRRADAPVWAGELADAVAGTQSVFGHKHGSAAGINIITTHDGLTLSDVVAYDRPNNSQPAPFGPSDGGYPMEPSRDQGSPENRRQAVRQGMMLNILSKGIPLILGGDEMGRTQRGNNNGYNLDNDAIYINWPDFKRNQSLTKFVGFLLRLRKEHKVFRSPKLYDGSDHNGNGLKDITWYRPDGQEMVPADFGQAEPAMAYRLDASEYQEGPVRSIYILHNTSGRGVTARLPAPAPAYRWFSVVDTSTWLEAKSNFHEPGLETELAQEYYVHPGCSILLQERRTGAKPR